MWRIRRVVAFLVLTILQLVMILCTVILILKISTKYRGSPVVQYSPWQLMFQQTMSLEFQPPLMWHKSHSIKDSPFMVWQEDVKDMARKIPTVPIENARVPPEPKIIAYYHTPAWNNLTFDMKRCKYSNCKLVSAREHMENADVVVFHGVDLNTTEPPPRPQGQIWIVMGYEAPVHYHGFLNTPSWRGVFNWTMTGRVDSDIFSPYGLLMEKKKPRETGYPSLDYFKKIARSKTRVALFLVSNCFSKSARKEYVEDLKKYMQADILGHCGMPTECPRGNRSCTADLVNKYVFLLAFENSFCKDYVTEKFFRLFEGGIHTIPVVRGGTDYHRYFPEGTFINTADFESPRHLAMHLNRIASNATLIAEILQTMSRYGRVSISRHCKICEHLHRYGISKSGFDPSVSEKDRQSVTKTYSDVFDWLSRGMCYNATDIKYSKWAL